MDTKKVILIFFSAILIIITVVVAISKTIVPVVKNANYEKYIQEKNKQFVEQVNKDESEEKNNDNEQIANVPENDGQRVGTYIGQYIGLINSKEYEKAYNLLNEGFKKINFPSLESFVEYASKKYVRQKTVEYVNFKIEGFVYVVDTVIKDLAIYENPQKFQQVFRFQETEPGKFNLSFGI